MTKQPWKILPINRLGKWSIGLIVAMPIFFFIGSSLTNSLYKSIPAGETILADIALRPALALSMLAGMATGIAAFITGLLDLAQKKEKALLVYLSTILGALLIFYLAGEVVSPHQERAALCWLKFTQLLKNGRAGGYTSVLKICVLGFFIG